jgi:tetratricopeptide (TPR) repeat protein/O-antigen ligase
MELRHQPLIRKLVYVLIGFCPVFFFTDQTRNPYFIQIVLVNALIALAWLILLARMWREHEWTWVLSPLDSLLLCFIALAVVSWGVSAYQHRIFFSAVYSEGSRNMLFLVINVYLAYALALRLMDWDFFRSILLVAYGVSLAASVYALAQYFGTEWFWPQAMNPYGFRPVSTFGNPNFLSSFLILVIPLMVADQAFAFTRVPRAILFILTLIDTGALLATLTRSSWAGLAVALIVWIAATASKWGRSTKNLLSALFIAMVVLAIFWPKGGGQLYSATVIQRLTEVEKTAKESYGPVDQRLLIWTSAWHMVEEHPFLGAGWGCFELFYPYYQGPELFINRFRNYRTHANNTHNEILENWSQIGALGLGLIILIWVVYFRTGYSLAERSPRPAIHWALIGAVAGMLVDNLLNVSIHFTVPALFLWIWVAATFALDPDACRVVRKQLTVFHRFVLAVAMIFLAGFMVHNAALWAAEVNFFKGFSLAKAGIDLTGARLSLERAYRLHPLEVNNNYELANLYARLGERDLALAMYKRSLDANPGYDEIFYNRGTELMEMKRFDEAMASYRIALGINPESHEAYRALTAVLTRDIPKYGDLLEQVLKQALLFFPDDKDLWNNLGYMETQRQKWEESYSAYRRALEIDPDFEVARKNLEIIARKVPYHADDPLLHLNRFLAEGEGFIKARNWNAAIPVLQKVVAISPNNLRGRLYLGNSYFSMNRFAEAAEQFESALRNFPNAPAVLQNLAITYDRLGRTDDAVSLWRRISEQDPNNALARQRLGLK